MATALVVGQFTVAVSSPLWGWLIDRYGPRRAILPSIVGLFHRLRQRCRIPCSPLTFGNLYLLLALFSAPRRRRIANRLCGGAGAQLFERRLGLALGLSIGMGIGFGATLLPSLAQMFVGRYGWRTAYAAPRDHYIGSRHIPAANRRRTPQCAPSSLPTVFANALPSCR